MDFPLPCSGNKPACLKSGMKVWTMTLLATIAIVLAIPVAQANRELQAEDVLYCPALELPEPVRQELQQIVHERQELARSITAEDFCAVATPFGIRVDLPEKVVQWRAEECRRVRALIPSAAIAAVEAFAESIREQSEDYERRYPLKQQFALELTKAVRQEGQGKVLLLDLSVPTESSGYTLVHELAEEAQGKLVIRVTLVRPSYYLVRDKESSPEKIRARITYAGLPKAVEIWTRAIDQTLPLNVSFQRLGTMPIISQGS